MRILKAECVTLAPRAMAPSLTQSQIISRVDCQEMSRIESLEFPCLEFPRIF